MNKAWRLINGGSSRFGPELLRLNRERNGTLSVFGKTSNDLIGLSLLVELLEFPVRISCVELGMIFYDDSDSEKIGPEMGQSEECDSTILCRG